MFSPGIGSAIKWPMRTPPRHKSSDLPDDIDALKGAVGVLERELYNRDLLIEKLKHQLAGLRRNQFGSRSERLDQLEMRLEDEEIAEAGEAPTVGQCHVWTAPVLQGFC